MYSPSCPSERVGTSTRHRRLQVGEFHDKSRALSLLGVYGYLAVVEQDNLLRESHAYAVPFYDRILLAPVEEGEEVLLVDRAHAYAVVGESHDYPLVPIGYLNDRYVVGRIFAVVLDEVGKGNGQQVVIALYGDEAVVVGIFLFENQFDAVVVMSAEYVSRTSSNSSSSRISSILICSWL